MESTLALQKKDLEAEVGLFLGRGRGAEFGDPEWSDYDKGVIESIVKSGLRQFYFPPIALGHSATYDWSFLRPTGTVVLVDGDRSVPLPDDFGGLEGQLNVSSPTDAAYWPVPVTSDGQVDRKFSEFPDQTGQPLFVSIRPIKRTSYREGQRFELYVFPEADQNYTLRFQYHLLPDCLTGSYPHIYGGAAHAETVLESCLCIAEQRRDDMAGVHSMKFQERLLASIGRDQKHKPQLLGYNGDRSDHPRRLYGREHLHGLAQVTFDGVLYGD